MQTHKEVESFSYKVSHSFKILYFGPLAYIHSTNSDGDVEEIVISKKLFLSKRETDNNLHRWIHDIPYWDHYVLVTEKYYKYYIDGARYSWDDGSIQKKSVLACLKAGDFSRIFKDKVMEDGFLYDKNNRKVFRKFCLDYVKGHITSATYKLPVAYALMKNNSQVTNLIQIEIPYYNQDISGEEAIEFTFTPTKKQFAKWTKKDYSESFEMCEKIIKALGIGTAKYAKELTDDSEE